MKPASRRTRCGWAARLFAGGGNVRVGATCLQPGAALLLAGALCVASAVHAAEPASDAATPEAVGKADAKPDTKADNKSSSRAQVLTHKLRLTQQQLAQSPSVKRILQSDNALAQAALTQAQQLYDQAVLEARAGNIDAGTLLVDESLRLIVTAARMAPDTNLLAAQERQHNAELREAIQTFHLLHKNFSNRLAAINAPAPEVDSDIERLDAMTSQADALISNGQQHEAHVLLSSAHLIVVSTLNKMLMSQTFVYDLKFDSPADEFQHELAKNIGLEELVPMALQQVKVKQEVADLAERYRQHGRALRTTAQQQVHGGDYAAGLKSIQEASVLLQHALRMAGVAIPQSPEITR